MTTDAIVADIVHETDREIERLLAEADARAAAILDGARTEVRLAVATAEARAEPQARLDAARRVNVARLRLLERRADVAMTRSEAVFAAAGRRLGAIADGADPDRWEQALARLVRESLRLAGPGAAAVVRPGDLPLVKDRIAEAGGFVVPDANAAPGVSMTSADGRIEIDATLPARLGRARLRLAEVVAVRLDPGG